MTYTQGGPVPLPSWMLILRATQVLLALLILSLTAYALSIHSGGPLQPPLISTLLISLLTLFPTILLTTPVLMSQRRIYDARIALGMDLAAMLFWLGTFAALAAYHDVFSAYGHDAGVDDVLFGACTHCRSSWRAGVAATVFSAFEFLLFLATTTSFAYYYHSHLSGHPALGLPTRTATPSLDKPHHSTDPSPPSSASEPPSSPPMDPQHTKFMNLRTPLSQHPIYRPMEPYTEGPTAEKSHTQRHSIQEPSGEPISPIPEHIPEEPDCPPSSESKQDTTTTTTATTTTQTEHGSCIGMPYRATKSPEPRSRHGSGYYGGNNNVPHPSTSLRSANGRSRRRNSVYGGLVDGRDGGFGGV